MADPDLQKQLEALGADVERLERLVRLLATRIHDREYHDVARVFGPRSALHLTEGVGELPLTSAENREIDKIASALRKSKLPPP